MSLNKTESGESIADAVLERSTCYAVDLGPTIVWVLPWQSEAAAGSLSGFIQSKGADTRSCAVDIDVARFLREYGDVCVLPAHHSPAWATLEENLPDRAADIEAIV